MPGTTGYLAAVTPWRHGGCLLEGQIRRLGREPALGHGDVFGERAVAETVYFIARAERRHAAASPLHNSGEVTARNREPRFADAPKSGRAENDRLAPDEVPVPRVGRTGAHRHQHVLRTGRRHRRLGQPQDILRRPVLMLDDHFHKTPPRRCLAKKAAMRRRASWADGS